MPLHILLPLSAIYMSCFSVARLSSQSPAKVVLNAVHQTHLVLLGVLWRSTSWSPRGWVGTLWQDLANELWLQITHISSRLEHWRAGSSLSRILSSFCQSNWVPDWGWWCEQGHSHATLMCWAKNPPLWFKIPGFFTTALPSLCWLFF